MNKRFSSWSIMKHLLVCLGTVGTLSGCGEIRKTLGLDTPPPDEFSVIEDQPLVVPPLIVPRDFELRAPQPGARRPQEKPMSEEAREALAGTSRKTFQEKSLQGSALLSEKPPREEKAEGKTDDPSLDPLTASLVSFEEAGVEEGNAHSPRIEEVKVLTPGKASSEGETPSEEIFHPLSGDKAFLQQVPQSSDEGDLDRQRLDKEMENSEKPKNFFEKIFFWQKDESKDLVDPEKEKERLDFKKHQEWREKVLNSGEEGFSKGGGVLKKKPTPQTCSEIYGSRALQANKVFYNLPEVPTEEAGVSPSKPFQTPEIVKKMTSSPEGKPSVSSGTKPPVRLLTHKKVPGHYKDLLQGESHPHKASPQKHGVGHRKVKLKRQEQNKRVEKKEGQEVEEPVLEKPVAVLENPLEGSSEEKNLALRKEPMEAGGEVSSGSPSSSPDLTAMNPDLSGAPASSSPATGAPAATVAPAESQGATDGSLVLNAATSNPLEERERKSSSEEEEEKKKAEEAQKEKMETLSPDSSAAKAG